MFYKQKLHKRFKRKILLSLAAASLLFGCTEDKNQLKQKVEAPKTGKTVAPAQEEKEEEATQKKRQKKETVANNEEKK